MHTSNLNQAIVDQFLRRGLLPGHIKEICESYRAQLNAMLAELATFPEGTRYTRPEGGLFVWVELPSGVQALPLLQKAVESHVAYVPGTHFFVEGGHDNTLRLNFSNATLQQIHDGMTTLRRLVEEASASRS